MVPSRTNEAPGPSRARACLGVSTAGPPQRASLRDLPTWERSRGASLAELPGRSLLLACGSVTVVIMRLFREVHVQTGLSTHRRVVRSVWYRQEHARTAHHRPRET